jgi:hypothetical protein
MSTLEEQARYLAELAAAVERLEAANSLRELTALELRLTGGAESAVGGAMLPSVERVGQSDASRTLGNVLPLNQQTNMLDNPTLEGGVSLLTLTTSEQEVAGAYDRAGESLGLGRTPGWLASKTVATACTIQFQSGSGRELQVSNPFHSAGPELLFTAFSSGTHEVILRSKDVALSNTGMNADSPYLVGAFAIANVVPMTLTNVTSRTATIELYNVTDAVVAGTTSFDLAALPASTRSIIRISCFATPNFAKTYRLRLRVTIVTSGAGASITYAVGEPQMQLAFTPDPGPFTPAISGWFPEAIMSPSGVSASPLILSALAGDSHARFRVLKDGTVGWGPGSAGADTNLYRASANLLKTDDQFEIANAGGKNTLRLTSTAANTGIEIGVDSNLYRVAANRLRSDDHIQALEGIATLDNNGNVSDASFATGAPPDGTIAVDHGGNKIWVRLSGAWKSVGVA